METFVTIPKDPSLPTNIDNNYSLAKIIWQILILW